MGRAVGVIINPESGRGKGGRTAPELGAELHRRGIDAALLVAGSATEALVMARKAVADGVDAIVAAGGDGTVNLGLQAVAGTDTPLGIIPLGTGNDNARLLGIPLDDLKAAIDIIADFKVASVDVAHLSTDSGEERWFLGVMSSGFDSCVNERANEMTWPKGEARYLRGILAELRTFKPVPYHVVLDGEELNDKGMLVAVGNGESYGGGMKVCAGARIDDGLLTVTWLHRLRKLEFLTVFPRVYKGTHITHPSVTQHLARKVRLEAPNQIAYADGERVGPLPVDVEVHPNGLRVITPQGLVHAP
ncbi:MAG: diacylglycerol kinase [Candidatus Nanopelagicales bacterium]|nr:diacylglycerol kinase [Candidatus Nanopelagicales bacterium]MDZ4250057.1 diacylglycerol kinase [Candidatus Nanopelagicales bacterium]